MTFYLGKTVRGEKAKAWSTAVTPAWKWGHHCHQVPWDGPSDGFCWRQATAVRQHHRAKGKTGIRCIPVYYNHTHTPLQQTKTIKHNPFSVLQMDALWTIMSPGAWFAKAIWWKRPSSEWSRFSLHKALKHRKLQLHRGKFFSVWHWHFWKVIT